MDTDEVARLSVAFGRAIKIRRVEMGFNQEELADRAKMARSFVSGVERGATKATVVSVWRLAQALECKPSDLWLKAEQIYLAR